MAIFYAVLVSVRLHQHDALWFVHIGDDALSSSHASPAITGHVRPQSKFGYDGQYYFFLASDPSRGRYYMQGNPGVVYSRIVYPMAARVLGGFSVTGIPWAMLIINLLAVVGTTAALGLWLRRRAAPVWPAALFGLYPGVIFTVIRDLTEPLAFALAAAAMLVFDPRRPRRLVAAAALFALALLTRETVLFFALAAAACLLPAWRKAAAFAVGCFAPLLVWRLVVGHWLGAQTQERGGSGWGVPFHGILAWPFDQQHRVIVWTVILPALVAGLGAVALLVRRRAPIYPLLLLANVLAFVVFLPASVDIDYAAASRAAVGVVLAAIYCVPAWRTLRLGRAGVVAGALGLSLAWYLLVVSHYGLDGFQLITT